MAYIVIFFLIIMIFIIVFILIVSKISSYKLMKFNDNINYNKNGGTNMIKRYIASILGFALALLFLVLGIVTQVPSKEISYYSFDDNGYEEYVGGDAYNYIIEATLRGGQISGAKTARAIYFSASGLFFVISLFGFTTELERKKAIYDTTRSEDEEESININ